MNNYLFDVGKAREIHESDTQQQEALLILRSRKLTKVSFEQDWSKDGSRLAPAINVLRKGWGFHIAGSGTKRDPYWLLEPKQSPTRIRTTVAIKDAYWDCDHWKEISKRRFENDNYRCVVCSGACHAELRCHHIVYHLFKETLDQLMTVCEHHHEMIHKDSRLKFPIGIELWVAERLLEVVAYPFEEWLLP